MAARFWIAISISTLLAVQGSALGQGRGKGLGHLKGHGNGHNHSGFVPPGLPFRGSVQGTINRFLPGIDIDHDHHHHDHHVYDHHHHAHAPPVRYSFTIGLPYAFAGNDSYYPGYYSYLYGPQTAGGVHLHYHNSGGYNSGAYDSGGAYAGSAYGVPTYASSSSPTPAVSNTYAGGNASLTAARSAFRLGRYRDAIVKAGEAAEVRPDDPATHQLLSQAMFALGDYRGAAIEAHAVMHYGQPADWPTIARMYADPSDYTGQLRALETNAKDNRDDAASAFLLGYQYQMLGHGDQADAWLARAVELAPEDRIAQSMLGPVIDDDTPLEIADKPASEPTITPITPTAPITRTAIQPRATETLPAPKSVLVPASSRIQTSTSGLPPPPTSERSISESAPASADTVPLVAPANSP